MVVVVVSPVDDRLAVSVHVYSPNIVCKMTGDNENFDKRDQPTRDKMHTVHFRVRMDRYPTGRIERSLSHSQIHQRKRCTYQFMETITFDVDRPGCHGAHVTVRIGKQHRSCAYRSCDDPQSAQWKPKRNEPVG